MALSDLLLGNIQEKIFQFAKLMVPGVGLFWMVKTLWQGFWNWLGDWFGGLVADLLAKINGQLAVLGVDLTPTSECAAFIGKANTIVPLDEAWRYILLYLAFASVVVGVKWTRNLIPGMS